MMQVLSMVLMSNSTLLHILHKNHPGVHSSSLIIDSLQENFSIQHIEFPTRARSGSDTPHILYLAHLLMIICLFDYKFNVHYCANMANWTGLPFQPFCHFNPLCQAGNLGQGVEECG
jgi:hypothetical protein